MARPTEATIKRLYALSGNLCAFSDCPVLLVEDAGTSIGEICHIRAQKPGGPRFDPRWPSTASHDFENLIVLCPNHHTIVDKRHKQFTVEILEQMKAAHGHKYGRLERADDMFAARILLRTYDRISVSGDNANVVVNSPGAIVGQTIHVRSASNKVTIQPPPGTIGADGAACRYIEYLIKRYNEFASADKDRSRPFSYGAISKTIETTFRGRWRSLSLADFDPVVNYLHSRINKTRIAKANTARGHRSFSSFAEFSNSESSEI